MLRYLSCLVATLGLGVSTLLAGQPVKNIIFLIGDGMSIASVSMMQLVNNYEPTIFDKAENIALQKSYSADNRVTDSAASGTALATGHKPNNTYLGVLPDGTPVESLTELAKSKGKATGVVVTTYLQHATPAAFYAHIPSRHDYATISEQLVNSNLDLAIGGGMEFFKERYGNKRKAVQAIGEAGWSLARSWESVEEFTAEDRVLGLIADTEVGAESGDYLRNATTKAIEILESRGGDEGFVLMVEGSLIDGMGHANNAIAQQAEMQSFMGAIEAAVEYAGTHPGTLVVVTADHGTGGLALVSANADFTLAEQGVEFRWCTNGHSAEMLPIYLYGTGCELINGIMENSELGIKLKSLIE